MNFRVERKRIKARKEHSGEYESVSVFALFLIREKGEIYGNAARKSELSDRIIINGDRCIFHVVLRELLRCTENPMM